MTPLETAAWSAAFLVIFGAALAFALWIIAGGIWVAILTLFDREGR